MSGSARFVLVVTCSSSLELITVFEGVGDEVRRTGQQARLDPAGARTEGGGEVGLIICQIIIWMHFINIMVV